MQIRKVDKSGLNYFILEVNIDISAILKRIKLFILSKYSRLKYKLNPVGTWTTREGVWIRLSSSIPGLNKTQDWMKTMDGEADMRRGYASMENKGTLNKVDDRDVQERFTNSNWQKG